MKIYIGADHAGFELKNTLMHFLVDLGYEIEDKGAFEYDESDDYPDFVIPVANAVANSHLGVRLPSDEGVRGIVIGGSGQGEAICANRFRGVRAVVFNGPSARHLTTTGEKKEHDEIILSREHNDSNILSLGARFLNNDEAKSAVRLWLETPFSGDERHIRRIKKIDDVVS